jgi:dephospho-CoA kinase
VRAPPPKPPARPPDAPPPSWATDPDGLLASAPGSVKAALTGGIATGKSMVAELLAAFGAGRVDFDELCRRAVAKDSEGLAEVAALLGGGVLTPDGQLDRPKVARLVFKDPEARKALEGVIHPLAWRLMLSELAKLPTAPLVVVETPLLYEAALDSLFKPVLLCFARPETQKARLRARDRLGWLAARRRLAAQTPIMEKLRRADIVIDNDGPPARLVRRVKGVWDLLTGPDYRP